MLSKNSILLLVSFLLIVGAITAKPSKYQLNEPLLEEVLNHCEETSFLPSDNLFKCTFTRSQEGEIQTRGGYLIRAFFCGFIALHRTYMGTNGETMWWFYCCVPLAGPIDHFVDFWWVVFDDKAFEKYRNNSKFFVWMENM